MLRPSHVVQQSFQGVSLLTRLVGALLVLFVSCSAWAQQENVDLFKTLRPDLMIVVEKHSLGTDTVTITPLETNYGKDLLLQQINDLGSRLGSQVKGVQTEEINPIPGNTKTAAVRISFGVDGLIDREQNRLGVGFIAQAFAAGPDGEPNALLIQYGSEAPSAKIWKNYANEGLTLQGQADPRFGIEYRIKLLTTDPEKIDIPEGPDAQKPAPKPTPTDSKDGPNWLIIGVVAIAALAVGALVYSLLLRPRSTIR